MTTLQTILYLTAFLALCAVPVCLAWWVVHSRVRLKWFHLFATTPLLGFIILLVLIETRKTLLSAVIATIDYVVGLIRAMPSWSVLVVVLLFLIWRSLERLARTVEDAAGDHDET